MTVRYIGRIGLIAALVMGGLLACAAPHALPSPAAPSVTPPRPPAETTRPASPPSSTSTAPAATPTPRRTITVTAPEPSPSATATVALASDGPWLVYRAEAGWAALAAAGSALLAGEPFTPPLASAVKDDGALFTAPVANEGWFAYYGASGSDNLGLTVMRLPDQKVGLQLPLLSDDLAKQAAAEPEAWPAAVEALLFRRPLWSPDGRTLAFAGAFETPNPALYVFTPGDVAPRRLTEGDVPAALVAWSPDGQWLLYETLWAGEPGQTPVVQALWAVSVADGVSRQLYKIVNETQTAPKLLGWSPAGEAVFFMPDVDGGMNALGVAFTPGTGVSTVWQQGTYSDMAYDPQTGVLALVPISVNGPDSLVLARPDGQQLQPSTLASQIWPAIDWLPGLSRFFSYGVFDVILLSPDGSYVSLPEEVAQQTEERPAVSPGGEWLAFWNAQGGLRLYTAAGQLARAVEAEGGVGIIAAVWNPDGRGLHFVDGDGRLYSLPLTESRPALRATGVDPSVVNGLPSDSANLGWVRASAGPELDQAPAATATLVVTPGSPTH